MFADQIGSFLDAYATEFLAAYLLAGFIGGYFVVRDGKCESPATTWLLFTVAGPFICVTLALMLAPLLPFVILSVIFGIESSDYDSRGA